MIDGNVKQFEFAVGTTGTPAFVAATAGFASNR